MSGEAMVRLSKFKAFMSGKKMELLKRLKEIGVKDAETRVEIIHEIKRIVERRFGNAL